jgi:hypothetical protein
MNKDDREGCVFSTADLEELRKFEDSIPSREPIDLQDAIRAYRDRPSMERELQDLREQRDCVLAGMKNETEMRDKYCAAMQEICRQFELRRFKDQVLLSGDMERIARDALSKKGE